MPQGDLQEQLMFVKYAKAFIKNAWRPEDTVRIEDVVNFRTFLEKYSNYPGPRKRALLELRESLNICHTKGKKDVAACKGFIKFECYDEPKAPRAINSPSDESKTILAALCHAVDKNLCQEMVCERIEPQDVAIASRRHIRWKSCCRD